MTVFDILVELNVAAIVVITRAVLPGDTELGNYRDALQLYDKIEFSPSNVTINPNTNLVYVANSGSNTVSVINDSSDKVVKKVTVGVSPRGIAVNPNTNIVYVANHDSNTVSIIDAKTNNVTKTIPVGMGIAVNPNTNLVYVANSGYGSESLPFSGTSFFW